MSTVSLDVPIQYAWLDLDRAPLLFETTSARTFEFLRNLRVFFNKSVPFALTVVDGPLASPLPTLRYDESDSFSLSYDEPADRLTLLAPASAIPGSDLLQMSLWILRERVRQREGRIRLHASAVARDGRAMLMIGGSESGKTTTTLELCLRHGYRLCANDMVEIALQQDRVTIVGGDKVINFRLRSLRQYSPEFAKFVFAEQSDAPNDWAVKRELHASECGIGYDETTVPIDRVVFLRLDRDCSPPCVLVLGDERERRLTRWAKATLFEESCLLVRGAGFTPLDSAGNFVPLGIPSLDSPELVAGRVRLLNALFAQARIQYYRGNLEAFVAVVTDAETSAAL